MCTGSLLWHFVFNFKALEKAKQSLEAENADLATELKSASAARADGEKKRKQAEAQLADLAAKLQDIERTRSVPGADSMLSTLAT